MLYQVRAIRRNYGILQLEEIKKTKGGSVEDGSVARDKTLAAILAENKAKKEEAFQDVWRSMKQGVLDLLGTFFKAPCFQSAERGSPFVGQ